MNSLESLTRLTARYHPTSPLPEIVPQLNVWFHEYEASSYEQHHGEIFDALPQLWQAMLDQAFQLLSDRPLRVLDFGCGTGFAAAQALAHSSEHRIREIVCYDLSPEMLDGCRERFSGDPRVQFTHHFDDVTALPARFDLLLTNSILHHLPDPSAQIAQLVELLTEDGVWINGHEPSNRFLKNEECFRVFSNYQQQARWFRMLSPTVVYRALARALSLGDNPYARTADRAFEAGLFLKRPSERLISELVDLHVPRTPEDALLGRGFDLRDLSRELSDSWRLIWSQTYNFLGPVYEGSVGTRWREQCDELRRRFPDDGANYCALWQRNLLRA